MAPRLLLLSIVWVAISVVTGQEYRDGQYPSKTSLFGVTFSPFAANPGDICLPPKQVASDMEQISKVADHVRIYSLSNCPETYKALFEEAKKRDIRVIAGLFLSGNTTFNRAEMREVKKIASNYGDIIDAILVGNEVLFSKSLTVDELISYIRQVKDILTDGGYMIPVATGEIWPVYESDVGPKVVAECDFVGLNQQPFWEGWEVTCPPDSDISVCSPAAEYVHAKAGGLETYFGKPVWVVESGWPTEGEKCCQGRANARDNLLAEPSVENTDTFVDGLVSGGRAVGRPTYIHAMFDEEWKRIFAPCGTCEGLSTLLEDPTCNSCELEYHWGLYTVDRKIKKGITLPSPP